MVAIESVSEVAEAVVRAKAGGLSYCSNVFTDPRKLQCWIERGEFFREEAGGAALFLRRDRDFWHLYFCAGSPTQLRDAVCAAPRLKTEPVVVDLVGREDALDCLVEAFREAGFKGYQRLFRMARIDQAGALTAVPSDPRVVVAGPMDCQSIEEVLLQSFDRRAEQIPLLYEIEAAVRSGQIWVARAEGALAGLLYFETHGLTSTLRYWLVAADFRGQRFGSELMRRYFEASNAVRRFLLWVVADNHDAISKYEHYGFLPDGLVDIVLANEIIRP